MKTDRLSILSAMEATGVVAVIRADSPAQLVDVCKSLRDGGVIFSEITMTTPGALDAIAHARQALAKDAYIGVGSVLDPETCRAAILAGAQFVVSPTLNPEVIAMAHRYGKPIISGGLTPTEVINAYTAGADVVKVFPANVFGPSYFKDLLAPMPQLKLTPTGGVDLSTTQAWIKAGAVCVGVGSSLVKKDFLQNKDWTGLANLAKQYIDLVQSARA
jgi:2-dehydro-3-deoxyphosphogluconate aldolase / (4S)-4-hydroxy-2-oxoglutarate aldolase